MSEFYDSAWHHPGFAWIGTGLLLALFHRVVPSALRRFTAIAAAAIILDAYLTGALSPWKTGEVAKWISIVFVIAGDLRYFYLLERDRGTRHSLLTATALAFVVPLSQTALMEWIYPAPFVSRRVIFLSYESLFVVFASLSWLFRYRADAGRFRHSLFAYEIIQYVLWAGVDVLLLSGIEGALALRLIPNALYYAGFLWFVMLSWRRFA